MNSTEKMTKYSPITPGQLIKKAREEKQISLHEVMQRLLLNRQIILDIENDDYGRIPARVYAEGYLRAYAKFLDLSIDEVLESFRKLELYQENHEVVETQNSQYCDKPAVREDGYFFKINSRLAIAIFIATIILFVTSGLFFKKSVSTKDQENFSKDDTVHTMNSSILDGTIISTDSLDRETPLITNGEY